MSKAIITLLLFVISTGFTSIDAQSINAQILNEKNSQPIEFANIGIPLKNAGTVSDEDGYFKLDIKNDMLNDTIVISCIGFYSLTIPVKSLFVDEIIRLFLKEKVTTLSDIHVKPTKFKEKKLGIKGLRKFVSGFSENQLGYECGILFKNKKRAFLKSVTINIATCSYDSLFYRLNVYEVQNELDFLNILMKPIYINIPREKINSSITVPLEEYNIVTNGNFIVTLEHVKDLGKGHLYFASAPLQTTYYRKTSHGQWEKVLIGVGISVNADVEL